VWRSGERYGLFRREKQYPSRLYLSGKVIRLASNSEPNGFRGPSRCTTAPSPPVLPGYLERQIAKWEPDRRAAFLSRLQRMEQRECELKREAMAAVRAIVDGRQLRVDDGLQAQLSFVDARLQGLDGRRDCLGLFALKLVGPLTAGVREAAAAIAPWFARP